MQAKTPISKIMTTKPETVKPTDNIETVRQIFVKHGFHHVPVVENHKLVGIVSYTDYLHVIREVSGNASEVRANEKWLNAVLVKDIMTEHVLCVSPTDTLESALRVFRANKFHAIPVIDGDRKLAGILTTYDLLKVLEALLTPEVLYAE